MTYPTEKPRVRIFTWIILVLNVLWLMLLIVQLTNLSHPANDCRSLSQSTCTAAKDIGTTIGAGLIIGLWVAMDVILGILWIVTRKRQPQVIYMNGAPPAPNCASPDHSLPQPIPSYRAVAVASPQVAQTAAGSVKASGERTFAVSGGQHRGSGSGSTVVQVARDQQMTFTCGGTWGRTVLAVDGQVVVDVTGAQTSYRVVRATGQPLHFDVDTDGTWTIYLRKATRSEAR
ncbi:hypothetical protein ABIB25_002078 [Nakamurella sp. UYEF19]|uniref:hypothetical protein n=1 Tax=Nakamurella sp. UYEF19 TaxID=1756392 RepID=UPI0033922F68